MTSAAVPESQPVAVAADVAPLGATVVAVIPEVSAVARILPHPLEFFGLIRKAINRRNNSWSLFNYTRLVGHERAIRLNDCIFLGEFLSQHLMNDARLYIGGVGNNCVLSYIYPKQFSCPHSTLKT